MKASTSERIIDRRVSYVLTIGLPLGSIIALVAFTGAFFARATPPERTDGLSPVYVYCTPDGHTRATLEYSYPYNQYWDPSLVLSITLGLGDLKYAAARGIDLAWDLVVGRGGQIFLALLAYPVLRRSLRRHMEKSPVRLRTFASVSFDKISLSALWTTFRDLVARREPSDENFGLPPGWRHFGHLLILTYVLAFPTLASFMTGYQAKCSYCANTALLRQITSLRFQSQTCTDNVLTSG